MAGPMQTLLGGPTERHIARRYLYRPRRSRGLLALSAVLLVLAAGTVANYFAVPAQHQHQHHPGLLGGALAILGPLAFLVVALLNLFSVFSTVAVVGVLLGVASLTVVTAVTSGFQREIQNRVIGVNAHILVLKYGPDFREYEEVQKKIVGAERAVVAAAPFVFNEMLVAAPGSAASASASASSGVLVKGIDIARSPRVLDLEQDLLPGPDGTKPLVAALKVERSPNDPGWPGRPGRPGRGGPPLPGIFIGKELCKKLKAKEGDRLRLISPLMGMDGSIADLGGDEGHESRPVPPRSREFRLAGVFSAGFDEYDRKLVYVDLPQAQALIGQGDVVTGVELKLKDADQARKVSRELEALLGGPPYRTLDWEELNHNLFTALALQKTVLVLVLFLIVLVAAFNIVASLTMMVIDKTREIAILKAMGMSSGGVGAVFRSAGMSIGLFGTSMGTVMGLLVCAVVKRLGFLLDAKVYLIDRLPIRVSAPEIALTVAATLLICLFASLVPARRAANLPPVDGLRYE